MWYWEDYALEAPHREAAIAIYERLLREVPDLPALALVKGRLQRLEINVDSNYHRYWCLSD